MRGLYDFKKDIVVVVTRITPNLIDFLQDDFNFELTLRLVNDLKLQTKIRQLKPQLRYKQLISVLFTRFTLNRALENSLSQDISYKYNSYGKPSIHGLAFNTSSSNDILAVVLHSSPVGIDLSHSMQNVSLENYLKQFEPIFHKAELTQVDSYFKFNHFWTLKEAFTKLIGCGLNVELSDFYFTLSVDDEFNEDDYCLCKCSNSDEDSSVVDVRWYDKITTNTDKLFEDKNEFVEGLANEFYCYSTVIDKAYGDRLPVICSVATQQRTAKIKTYEVNFLTILERQMQNW